MRAVLTGISGFVGRHLAEHLVRCGDDVLGLARSGDWSTDVKNVEVKDLAGTKACPIFTWDLSTPLDHQIKQRIVDFRPEVIFHLGGISDPASCGRDVMTPHAYRVNVEGTGQILDLIEYLGGRAANSLVPKLVFASSCHVYAPVGAHCFVDETSLVQPRSPYGRSKYEAEQLIVQRAQSSPIIAGSRALIVRLFHFMGPGQPPQRMLSDWITQLKRPSLRLGPQTLKVRNDHTYLDLLDVRDGVRALRTLALLDLPGKATMSPRIYNLGSGIRQRNGQVLQTLLTVANQKPQIVVETTHEIWHPIAIIDKLLSTGWRPKLEVVQTLHDMWDSAGYSGN